MLDKFAGYKTQIRVLEKKLKEMDHSKLNPAKVKELTEAIQNLKNIVKEKEDKRIERKKKKDEAVTSKPAEVEAASQTPEVVKESLTTPTEVTKESTVEKFAVDSKVEPIRGTPGSWGVVIREAGVNGDPLCYVKWQEGALKTAHGEYGAYYPSDLKLKAEVVAEAKDPTAYVPREQLYNLEADLKSNHEQMIKDLEEEHKMALEKGEAVWAHRLEQKLNDAKKAYEERFGSEKTAEDENGSGGTEKLKVVDLNPAYDKDPQEKSIGYGGDRAYGWQTAPNGQENSLPLEASLKFADLDLESIEKRWALYVDGKLAIRTLTRQKADKVAKERFPEQLAAGKVEIKREDHVPVEASLNKQAMNITVEEKLFVVNPLQKTADNEYVYDVDLADGSKLFKITSKDEMGEEHLAYVIKKELTKEASNKCSICSMEFSSWPEYNAHKKEKHGPKMAKLTSNLAFLKKGSFVSILDVNKNKKQVKFASLDGSLRGWAPINKFSAYGDIKQNFVDHEGHKDEVFAESGNELLVSCPAGSTNVTWREITAPPATPESLNPDVTAAPKNKNLEYIKKEVAGPSDKEKQEQEEQDYYDSLMYHPASLKEARGCDQCEATMINGVFCHETGCPNARKEREQEEEFDIESSLNKSAHIRHEDGKWVIYSHDYKKKLGTYDTKEQATKRLREIEYFKHQGSIQPLSKKEAVQKEALENQPCDESGCNEPAVQYGHGGVWCAKHKKSSEKAASSEVPMPADKCEECGKELGPEAFLSKWPVCGKCTRKRHEKALGKHKKADQEISLEQQVQGFRDRMSAVTERLANPPAKTADLETTQDLSNVDVKDLSSAILHTIDLLESKIGENVSADPELHPMLEDLENKVYEIEMKMGIKPELPEHEKLEPEHSEIVKELGEEPVEKESDMSNVPPTTPAPRGFRYAFEPNSQAWVLVADPNATGTGTGGTY